jgi:hypothetical protein
MHSRHQMVVRLAVNADVLVKLNGRHPVPESDGRLN